MSQDNTTDYKPTIFLPKTDFPMRGGLPKREPEWIARWDDMGLYKKMRANAAARGAQPFILHDGPPYANGHIHLGTAMNKIIKDIITRSRWVSGYDASYIPGWDCHGLPIEWKVEEEFRAKGRTKDDVSGAEFRARCRAYAQEWVDIQAKEFRRLGVEGEWDAPYLTMNFASEAAIVGEFLRVSMAGLVKRGAKPIMWSPVERTALAEAEVEYADRKATTIWVKFPIQGDDKSVLIWTTTPWTIPANQAVCFSDKVAYGVYQVDAVQSAEELGFTPFAQIGEKLVVADALWDNVKASAKIAEATRVGDFQPESGLKLHHPFHEMDAFFAHDIAFIAGDHVTDEAGTGFVHTAPAHGEDDYFAFLSTGQSADKIRDIVDEDGCYRPEVPRFAGLDIVRTSGKKRGQDGKANAEVIKALTESGALLARGITTLRDAHSWRSKAPVIRRATPQWFIGMDIADDQGKTLRDKALSGIDATEFFPPKGKNRLRTMVEGRPDWLVSRQRNWGVPITLLVNAKGEAHTAALSPEDAAIINANITDAIAESGLEAWFDLPLEVFLKGTDAAASDWEKVTDVLDVWFDSGTTHAFCLRERGIIDEATGQADLYLEGTDQHRGWFQSSLLESCATRGLPPYKQVLTHGFIVDKDGKKMSKSLGNTIEPQKVADQYGIEILRIWTASADVTEDLRISDEILKGSAESYRRLRNTFRYLLGALQDYDAPVEHVALEDMPGLERWVLHRLAELDTQIRTAFDAYDFKRVMALLVNFAGVDLSAVYFDIRKDSLYCDPTPDTQGNWDAATAEYGNRRKAVRQTMAAVMERLLSWLAPIMPFTTEEAFLLSPFAAQAESLHLLTLPDTPEGWLNPDHAAKWEKIFRVRRVVTGALEVERREKRIGSSLDATPKVYIKDSVLRDVFEGESAADIFITSGAELLADDAPDGAFMLDNEGHVAVVPSLAIGQKCARSWKVFEASTALEGYADITPRDALAVMAQDVATQDKGS